MQAESSTIRDLHGLADTITDLASPCMKSNNYIIYFIKLECTIKSFGNSLGMG